MKTLVLYKRKKNTCDIFARNVTEKGKIKSCLYEFPIEATKFLPYLIGSNVTRDLRDKTLRDKLKHIKFDDKQNYQFFAFKLFL